MKGKISFYFNAPNTGKVRSRLENPSKELSANLRQAITASVVEVINESTLAIRAKLIQKFADLGETPKDKQKALELSSVLNSFFDVVVSTEKMGDDSEGEETQAGKSEPESAESEDFED
jgi:hypothetical protein